MRVLAGAVSIVLAGMGNAWAQAAVAPTGKHENTVGQVVVTATRSARSVEGVPASVSVITRRELQVRPVLDAADALRGQPGVNLQSIGQGRRGISVRGLDPGYTVTLVDGLRVNASANVIAHSDFDLGWIPVEAIDRIEFVRGPMSSLYGSDALGGVVNMITRSATDTWQGSTSVNAGHRRRGGGGDWWQWTAYAGGPIVKDTLGLSVFTERVKQDKDFDPLSPKVTRFEGRDASSGNLQLTWTPNLQQRVDLRMLSGYEKRNRHVALSGAVPTAYETIDRVRRQLQALSHSGHWSWGESRLSVTRSNMRKDNWRSSGAAQDPQTMRDTALNGYITLQAGTAQRITAGADWHREEVIDPLVNARGRDSSTQRALFLQDEVTFNPRWSLVAGGRQDWHDRFGGRFSPRVYVVNALGAGWTLKGGVGSGFRAPNLKQMSRQYVVTVAGSFTQYGNPDLKPETSTSYELAAGWARRGNQFDVALFDNRLSNLIQSVCIAQCSVPGRLATREYRNLERARTRGFELSGRYALDPRLRITGSYTFVDAQDLTNRRRLRLRARHVGSVGLNLQPATHLDLDLRGDYSGATLDYPTRGPTVRYPANWIFSAAARWQPLEMLTIRASVDNITNARQNTRQISYPYPEYGRSLSAGVQLSF